MILYKPKRFTKRIKKPFSYKCSWQTYGRTVWAYSQWDAVKRLEERHPYSRVTVSFGLIRVSL